MADAVIRGISTRVWKNAPPSLAAVLTLSRAYGDLDFLVYEDEHWTFDRHYCSAASLAHELRDGYGIQKGDRVAIAMRNLPEWAVAFWAAAAAGAVVVPLNAWWSSAELAYGLQDSGTKVLVCDQQRLDRLAPEARRPRRDRRPRRPPPARTRTGRRPTPRGGARGTARRPGPARGRTRTRRRRHDLLHVRHHRATKRSARHAPEHLHEPDQPRVRERPGALRNAPRPASESAGGRNVYLLSVPFFHATGCHSVLVANLAAGNELVLMYKWDPGRALELIEQERVTIFGGVPAMVWQTMEHPDFARRDLSSLRNVAYGGAPAAPELVRAIEARFPGRTPSNGYGLTETSSVTTMNSGLDYVHHPDSVGVPVPVCDVKVVDELGALLPPGEVGELWIQGPNVVKGYWNKPAETEASFSDGWLHSGDLARIDDEGFVYIVDRAKDLVIRGGENISSVEVEGVLFEHPAVTDAAVIGIPHPVLGEEVGAVVHTAPGTTVTADQLQAHVAARLAGFKVPARIWFLDEPLPRNPAGKILKPELKRILLGASGDSGHGS